MQNSLFKGPLGYRVCLWTAITVMALSTIIGLSMVTAFVALQPKAPSYDLQEIRVQVRDFYSLRRRPTFENMTLLASRTVLVAVLPDVISSFD